MAWPGTSTSIPSRAVSERSRPPVYHHKRPKARRSRRLISVATSVPSLGGHTAQCESQTPGRKRLRRDPDSQALTLLPRRIAVWLTGDPITHLETFVAARLAGFAGHWSSREPMNGSMHLLIPLPKPANHGSCAKAGAMLMISIWSGSSGTRLHYWNQTPRLQLGDGRPRRPQD